jgi:hypothetical protein
MQPNILRVGALKILTKLFLRENSYLNKVRRIALAGCIYRNVEIS